MKKCIAVLAALVVLALPAAASAGWEGQGNSTPGEERYDAIRAHVNPDAQCGTGGGSGAFGYFGKDFNIAGGEHREGGEQTGLNNSGVCGNRQGNLP